MRLQSLIAYMQFALALHIGDGFVESWPFSVLGFILLVIRNQLMGMFALLVAFTNLGTLVLVMTETWLSI